MNIFKNIIDILSALLVPIISFITIYIAIRQYSLEKKVSQIQLKSNLYEKRHYIYKSIMQFLSEVLTSGEVTQPSLIKFLQNTSESDFLFEKEISEHIDLIYKKSTLLKAKMKICEIRPYDEKSKNKLLDDEQEIKNWLTNQLKETKKLFSGYLKIE